MELIGQWRNAGKDATEEYEEIGHSKAAHELLSHYKIGKYKVCPPCTPKKSTDKDLQRLAACNSAHTDAI